MELVSQLVNSDDNNSCSIFAMSQPTSCSN